MRLHQLRVQAFGPFAEQVEVDFDTVTAGGLFLIHGPTGSGKTSLLDAVCFALYAAVPGSRERRHLASDHAAPGVTPTVWLEFSCAGRRFSVERSPEHARPKKRGTGQTRVPARVLLRELAGGEWRQVSNRNDEAALVLDDVLGMSLEQFRQVVMLPQGEFAAFLRAGADERRAVLERLFDISGYADVEQWFVDERREGDAAVREARASLELDLTRLGDVLADLDIRLGGDAESGDDAKVDDSDGGEGVALVGGDTESGDVDEGQNDAEVDAGIVVTDVAGLSDLAALAQGRVTDLPGVVTGARELVQSSLTAALTESARCDDAESAARTALERARTRAALRAKAKAARATAAALDAAESELAAARERVDLAERASALRGHLEALDSATTAHDDSRAGLAGVLATAPVGGATPPAGHGAPPTGPDTAPAGHDTPPAGHDTPPAGHDAPLSGGDAGAQPPAQVDRSMVAALLERARAHDARLARASADTDSLSSRLAQAGRLTEKVERAKAALRDAETALERHQEAYDESEASLARLTVDPADLTRCHGAVERAAERLARHGEVVTLRAELAALGTRLQNARVTHLDAKEHRLALQQARLDGMAAELAAGLVDGQACPVCGGAEHPAPARARTTPVTAAQVAAASEREETHARARDDLDRQHAALAARIETRAEPIAGLDEATLQDEHAAASLALAETQERSAAHDAALAVRERAHTRLAAATQTRDEARTSLTLSTTSYAERVEEVDRLTAQVRDLLAQHAADCPCAIDPAPATGRSGDLDDGLAGRLDDDGEGDLDDGGANERLARAGALAGAVIAVTTRHTRHVGALRTVLEALDEHARSAATLADAETALGRALAESDLSSADEARAALLPAATLAGLRGRIADHAAARAATLAVLDDPDVIAASAGDDDDLAALTLAHTEAREAARAAASAHSRLDAAARAVDRLLPGVQATCATLGPLLARQELVSRLADTMVGTGPDNALRMRLTSFVLAARLERVAERANERLMSMGEGRYRLEHSDDLAARGRRSGLGLRVLDLWTGLARDTATLSGGESFMASLALALGLADAVREEAGGFELGTLFVDEGFGTLDDDSLEGVLGVLDALREGGRAVGVVSHVADLRPRIPSQIVVTKTTTGSSVTVRTGQDPAA